MADKPTAASLIEQMLWPTKPPEASYAERLLTGQVAPSQAEAQRIAQIIDPQRLRRLTGIAEAVGTVGSGLLGSVPAGLAGMAELLPTRGRAPDINRAAQRVEDVQQALTYIPRTETGQRVLQRGVAPLEMLGAPAEYLGEKTFEYTGSPATATAVNVLADPMNLIGTGLPTKAAKGAMQAAKALPKVPGALANVLLSGPTPGSRAAQRGAIKMKGGNWLANEVEGATEPLKPRGLTAADRQYALDRVEAIRERGFEPTVDDLRQIEQIPQNEAIRNWIDKKLNRYIKNEMATPEDPVRKLAEEGILHYQPEAMPRYMDDVWAMREKTGFPKMQATSPLAQRWEAYADQMVRAKQLGEPIRSGNIGGMTMRDLIASEPGGEWALKAPNEQMVYELRRPGTSSVQVVAEELGLPHLIDELKNAIRPDSDLPAHLRWKPEDLEKVTMEQAVRRVHDINEYRAAKKAEANEVLARNPATFTFKEYQTIPGSDAPNQKGLAWKEIKAPTEMEGEEFSGSLGKAYQSLSPEGQAAVREDFRKNRGRSALADALKYEGEVMGHCVGGYCDDVLSGKTQIYSLRDKKGEPHVTIEVKRNLPDPVYFYQDLPEVEQQKVQEAARMLQERDAGKTPDADFTDFLFEAMKQARDQAMAGRVSQEIVQIKGKANKAPKDEYLPFVQDFVRGGNWSRVGDFQNTGLRDMERTPNLRDWLRSKGVETPRYVTEQEYGKYEGDFLLDRLGKKEGGPVRMAEGGEVTIPDMTDGGKVIDGGPFKKGGDVKKKVHISNNPDAMRLAVSMQEGGSPRRKAAETILSGLKSLVKPAEGKSVLEGVKAVKPAEELPYTAKQVQSAAEKLAPKIKQENPKLSDDEAMKRALRQAEQKLKWEKVDRPELEKTYGALEKSKFNQPLAERQRNVPEVVEKRIKETREFLKEPTEPWTPPRKELQAFERERIKDALEGFPGVEQTKFPRYEPARADLGYTSEIYDDPVNRELIKGQIKRGLPLGGETFYASLYPLKLAALERGIPESKFNEFIYSIAPASARNSIMNEMAVGQFMRDMRARGLSLDEDTVKQEMAAFKQKYGTGLPLMPVHREGVKNVLEGGQDLREMLKADIPTNYKIPTYGTQKAGDFGKSMVLDVHESAGQTRGSRYHPYFTEQGGFGPTEYGAAENKMLDIAGEMGIPGGMAQAGRWFGGGELTGLKSPRGDALDLLEKQTAYTLQGMGVTPTPRNVRNYVLDMIEKGEGVLMPWFKKEGMPDVRTEKKKGGAVKKPRKVEVTDNLDAMRMAVQKRK